MSATLINNTTPVVDTTSVQTVPQQTHMAFRLPLPERIEEPINAEYMALTQRENAMAINDAELRAMERASRRPVFHHDIGTVRRTLFPVKC